ncbi:hypothetical protein M5K25_009914 [Dendrobium thyrsiflorum]|uniref:Uncharacterized protein n=1 Tax=Dendrobium thyrsiflorum TaxID=117978 RepID=A0ABD0V7D8_DENTH
MNISYGNLYCLPSCLPSLSYLQKICILDVPLLQELPELPSSLREPSFINVKYLQSLPSSLTSLSSLEILSIINVTQLRLLPNFPASLQELNLSDPEASQCLPSSVSISSLKRLHIIRIPLLKFLPDLSPGFGISVPPTIAKYPHLSGRIKLFRSRSIAVPAIFFVHLFPQKTSLNKNSAPKIIADLSPSLKFLSIEDCHPELMERYQTGYSRRKQKQDFGNLRYSGFRSKQMMKMIQASDE